MDDAILRTLRDLATMLDEAKIPFALIGGIAAGFRGEPRITADIDVVAGIEGSDAIDLLKSVERWHFAPLFPDVEEVIRTAFILPLRHLDTLVKADIAIGVSGYERQVIARARRERLGNLIVPVATAEDLILMKTLTGRPRDGEDALAIAVRCRDEIDWDYIMENGRQLQEANDQDLLTPLPALRESGGG